MVRYVEIHPVDPQPRLVDKVVEHIRSGEVIAFPTDSGYALGCSLGNKEGLERIRSIRQVGDKHHFTLLCHDFAQLGQLAIVGNSEFRLIKSLTPGPYTFILKGTKDVPRISVNPKKHTVGARIPDHRMSQAILESLGEAMLTSSLILPGEEDPMVNGWEVKDDLGHVVDVVVEGPCGEGGPTTVLDFVKGKIARVGAGSVEGIEL